MLTSFSNISEQVATRNFGGTIVGIAEPYVTGYHHIWFDYLPKIVIPSNDIPNDSGSAGTTGSGSSEVYSSDTDVQLILAGSCLSVTPPGGTLNKISFTGLGGTKWAVPGGIDYGDSISIKFVEYSGLPVCQIFHTWVKGIRDYRTGVSSRLIAGSDRSGYNKSKYAAKLYYWTTAPDGVTIEYAACYTGVFPLKDPQDLLSSDVENIGKIEPEIEFNVDYIWHEPWVYEACKDLTNDRVKTGFDNALTKKIKQNK